ncbi:MFS general substrate transporter [Glarea lozoyensis ATCC 20868]|uniref:MFS general substrate transporter n=1 Tax=Glarea lozoyensis (strain ATCC 20868 / MF5171) TaxID=1116229 RepID=S3D082_GLAL2|nr:MFS general substrate transporter [Glarea lozoyensis ATCC 20868]EPE30569.1 MFS general substrate transporter [Glarea lozoyensis ATCC 20868]
MDFTVENITREAMTMEDIAPLPIPKEQLLHSRYQCNFIFILLGLTYILWYTREVVEAGRWFQRANNLDVEALWDEVNDMPEFGDFWEELGMMVFAIDLLWWRLWWFNLEIYDVLLHIIRLRLILKSSLLNVDSFIRVHIPLSDTEFDFLFMFILRSQRRSRERTRRRLRAMEVRHNQQLSLSHPILTRPSSRQDHASPPPDSPPRFPLSPTPTNDSEPELSFASGDPANPRNWPAWRKWSIIIAITLVDLTVSWGASGYSPAETEMEQIFGVGAEVGTLGLSLYVLGLALGPMTLAPLSEYFGRSPIYIISYGVFLCLILGTALVQNLGGFLVLRFFAGLFSAVTIANFGGTIADLFTSTETGPAMSVFLWAATVGSPSGYFLFSFIAATKGLRSVFWALLGISGGFWLIMILVLRETRHSIILSRLHKHHRQTSKQPIPQRIKLAAGNLYQKALKRPFTFLFTEPIVQFCALYNGYLYGLSFLFNSAFVIVFGAQGHGFGTIDTGLCFLGICVGITLGPITTAIFQEPYYQRKLKRSNRKPNPEDRVMLGKVAGITFPISLFWFAWTSYSFIHFIVPILASALWGWSFYTLILMTYTYTEDSYHTFSASALAGIGLIRNIAGAGFPLFGRQMYGRLGNQGASSLLAGLACLMVPIPFLLGRFGERLRGRSRWAGVGEEGGGSEGVERREAEGKDDEV